MNYLVVALFLWPWLRLLRLFRPCEPGRRLVIQTAKIGDWINSTPVIRALGPVDVVCAPVNLALARHDEHVRNAWALPARTGMRAKVSLAWKLFQQGYEELYVLMPNMHNTFVARLACAGKTRTLDTYKTSALVRWLGAGFQRQRHHRDDLTVDSYLRLANLPVTETARKMHATSPLFRPAEPCFQPGSQFRVGVSLSAGNRLKTLPMDLWQRLLTALAPYTPSVYVFGLEDERPLLDALRPRVAGLPVTLVDCLGSASMPVEAVPWHVAQMHLYISSDTGNSYIADSLGVPLVNFAGPCHMAEQRPLGERALIVETPGLRPFTFIFETRYESALPPEKLYAVGDAELQRIARFIGDCHRLAQTRHWRGSGILP